MIVLVWVTLLFSMRSSKADAGGSLQEETFCSYDDYCVTLRPEITAEAGLCAVIPCSFTTYYYFTPQHIVWFKCASKKEKCGDSDIIYHLNKNNGNAQTGFMGRVSQLEPDVRQRNCSIIINDLRESDSGSYQFRVEGLLSGRTDGFTFTQRTRVSVKGLSQTPTVKVPPLTAGQQNTLTCTAPGLCSGPAPTFTWMWRKPGGSCSNITGNITVSTEEVNAVAQRRSSTLTFDPSAEHHGTEVTCKVSFTEGATEETVKLNVSFPPKILNGSGCVSQGEVLTCVCITEGFPLPTISWRLKDELSNYSSTGSKPTANSSITLQVTAQSRPAVECVSRNENGEISEVLTMTTGVKQEVSYGLDAVSALTITVVLSLILNVFFIIYFVFVCKSRKTAKPDPEDRTYMSLQKTDPSPEYDEIKQRNN